MRKSLKQAHKKSGIALIMVLMSLALIAIFITQLTYTSNIDLTITKKNQKRLQAYYLAHSAARMGLLRIHIYKELENMLSGQSGLAGLIPPAVRPMVWSFPLPEFPLPVSGENEPSSAPGKFISIIKGEGSKIPINLLDGLYYRMPPTIKNKAEAEGAANDVRAQIQQLLELREENDEKFREKMERNYRTAFVDSLKDWIDSDNALTEGGDESTIYERKNPPYKQRNDRIPNLSEVSMVDLWDDDVFSYLKNELSTLSVYPRVNCNTMSLDRFKAYSKNQLTDSSLGLIAQRRIEEPFTSLNDCINFIRTNPDIIGGGDFNIPDEVKKYAGEGANRESAFIVEGSSTVGDSRALIRLYIRIDEDAPKAKKQGEPVTDGKFKDVRVIRFEEGAPR